MILSSDVGEVAHEGHVQPRVAEVADQYVEDDRRAGVTDVAEIVGRDAADVHRDVSGLEGNEFFLFLVRLL